MRPFTSPSRRFTGMSASVAFVLAAAAALLVCVNAASGSAAATGPAKSSGNAAAHTASSSRMVATGTAGSPAIDGAASSPGAAAVGAGTPQCATSQLVVWLNTAGNGAAGSIYYELKLTNLSQHRCSLSGYPGVSAVGLNGRQLGRPASRERTERPRPVVLQSGATAGATLRIVEAGNFPASRCKPVTAAGLRVYPPGGTGSKLVPFPFEACSRRGPAFIAVGAVHKAQA